MAKVVRIILEVDDKGNAKIVKGAKKVQTAAEQATRAANKAYKKFEMQVGKSLDNVFRKIVRWGALVGGALALGATAGILRTGAAFEQAMANINAIIRPTARNMALLSDRARELGRTTVFSSKEAAEGMQKLALAGFSVREIMQSIKPALDLAAAGELDMAEAARITANVMRGMSIQAKDFVGAANALVFAATNSNQTISEMGHAFKFIGPVANAIKADITELSSALAVLANVGLRGEMAGTGLRRSLTVFLGEIPEGTEGIGKMNLQLKKGADGVFSLADALDEMTKRGITAADVMKAFGQRAGPAMLALKAVGGDAIRAFQKQIIEVNTTIGNLSTVIAGLKLDTAIGDWRLLQSAMADLSIEIFQSISPSIRQLTQDIRKMVVGSDGKGGFVAWVKARDIVDILAHSLNLLIKSFVILLGLRVALWIRTLTAEMGGLSVAIKKTNIDALTASFRKLGAAGKAAALGGLAVAGLVAFDLGWQFGRLIAETLGLDKKLTAFFENLLTNIDEVKRQIDSSVGVFDIWVKRVQDAGFRPGQFVPQETINRIGLLKGEIYELTERLRKGGFTDVDTKGELKDALIAAQEELAGLTDEAVRNMATFKDLKSAMAEHQDLIDKYPDMYQKAMDQAGMAYENFAGFLKEASEAERIAFEELTKGAGETAKEVEKIKNKLISAGVYYETLGTDTDALAKKTAELGKAVGLAVGKEGMFRAIHQQILDMGTAIANAGKKMEDLTLEAFTVAIDVEIEGLGEKGITGGMDASAFDEIVAGAKAAAAEMDFATKGQELLHALELVRTKVAEWKGDQKEVTKAAKESQKHYEEVANTMSEMFDGDVFGQAMDQMGEDFSKRAMQNMNPEEFAAAYSERVQGVFDNTPPNIMTADIYGPQLDELVAAFGVATEEMGVSTEAFALGFSDEIQQMVLNMQAAGDEVPEYLQEMFDFLLENEIQLYNEDQLEADLLRMELFQEQWKEKWGDLVETQATALLQMSVQAIATGENLSKAFKRWKDMAIRQFTQMLAKWAIERLRLFIMEKVLDKAVKTSQVASAAGTTYTNTFSSVSAIPIIGPAMAPGMAQAAAAQALAGGVGMVAAAAMGGLLNGAGTGTSDSILTALSSGEFVVRAASVDKLGEGFMQRLNADPESLLSGPDAGPLPSSPPGAGPASGPPVVVQITQTFTGDNWSENGISEELRESIDEATREAIEQGTSLPSPTEVV